ncbi:MAG: bifunctional riboflavin kinase/FAD synthetase [Proteiniphilum sp.]|nr:bifunctional riboflavin kinase/FAD synthetase [Proteiniphilum sp.]NCB23880.1 bifunctional riboflavin kinase/FAD synthetase [Bacteroidia bacterium]MDD2937449.1 bifunctional riboflavin kinase/FAD synthetase [Proteiniphilum sp.]MDD3075311.1 bifunctional riboflavin kinase/FAD synthetase [Proteiniphilum sp.]MDD3778523.1 bifunctional riboflavin kinase/FAD synthetase [Proteiniphilum sp.]
MDLSGNKEVNEAPFVASVGFFDGVHIGHRHLIKQVKEEAKRLGLPSAIVTFPVHPRKVLQKNYQPALLCGYEEKLEQLATTQIDYVISLPFTPELSRLSARSFMEEVLKEKIGVHTLFVGYDHRFGHNREEGFAAYQSYGEELGIQVIQAAEYQVEGENVSSTKIRLLLKKGEIQRANSLLSYHYTLSGKIVEGYRVGRTIGFPTANMRSWERFKVVPELGVYAVLVHIRDIIYKGMLYIGTRPTLHDDPEISVEVNIFDFSGDLYNQSLTVEFIDFIRADRKFDSMDELVAQIHKDKSQVQERLKNEK